MERSCIERTMGCHKFLILQISISLIENSNFFFLSLAVHFAAVLRTLKHVSPKKNILDPKLLVSLMSM